MKNRVKILVLAALLSGGIPSAFALVEQGYMTIADYDLNTATIWEIKLDEFLTSNCNKAQKATEYLRQIKQMGDVEDSGSADSGEDSWLADGVELVNHGGNKILPRYTAGMGALKFLGVKWPDKVTSALTCVGKVRGAITLASMAYHVSKGDEKGFYKDAATVVKLLAFPVLSKLNFIGGPLIVFAWTMEAWVESERAVASEKRKTALSQAFGTYFTGKDVPKVYERLKFVVEDAIGEGASADVNACIDKEIGQFVDEFADKPEIKVSLYKEHYEGSFGGGYAKFSADVRALRNEVKWTLYRSGVYDRLVKDATRACMKLAKREAKTIQNFFNDRIRFKIRIEDADGKAMDKYAGCHVWLRDSARENDRRKMLGRIGKDGTAVIECTRLGYELAGLPTMCDIFKTDGTPWLSDVPILSQPFEVGKKNEDVEIVLKSKDEEEKPKDKEKKADDSEPKPTGTTTNATDTATGKKERRAYHAGECGGVAIFKNVYYADGSDVYKCQKCGALIHNAGVRFE